MQNKLWALIFYIMSRTLYKAEYSLSPTIINNNISKLSNSKNEKKWVNGGSLFKKIIMIFPQEF